ncbi:MAG: DUF6273 domain-containing protein [Micrococcales bacterium]|nr:DUF6273 domain-containing protein [Micrococcales bacterium]
MVATVGAEAAHRREMVTRASRVRVRGLNNFQGIWVERVARVLLVVAVWAAAWFATTTGPRWSWVLVAVAGVLAARWVTFAGRLATETEHFDAKKAVFLRITGVIVCTLAELVCAAVLSGPWLAAVGKALFQQSTPDGWGPAAGWAAFLVAGTFFAIASSMLTAKHSELGKAARSLPGRYDPREDSPARMLTPDHDVAPYQVSWSGIDPADVIEWVERGGEDCVRLVTGPGGWGKTRLLVEAVDKAAAAKKRFYHYRPQARRLGSVVADDLGGDEPLVDRIARAAGRHPTLVFIDHADASTFKDSDGTSLILPEVKAAARHARNGGRIKVLLAARRADLKRDLQAGGLTLGDDWHWRIGSSRKQGEQAFLKAFMESVEAYREALRSPQQSGVDTAALPSITEAPTPLARNFFALAEALRTSTAELDTLPKVLERLAKHEEHYWWRHAESMMQESVWCDAGQLDAASDDLYFTVRKNGINFLRDVLVVRALLFWDEEQGGVLEDLPEKWQEVVVERVTAARGILGVSCAATAEVLTWLYPGRYRGPKVSSISTIQPTPLLEHIVWKELSEGSLLSEDLVAELIADLPLDRALSVVGVLQRTFDSAKQVREKGVFARRAELERAWDEWLAKGCTKACDAGGLWLADAEAAVEATEAFRQVVEVPWLRDLPVALARCLFAWWSARRSTETSDEIEAGYAEAGDNLAGALLRRARERKKDAEKKKGTPESYASCYVGVAEDYAELIEVLSLFPDLQVHQAQMYVEASRSVGDAALWLMSRGTWGVWDAPVPDITRSLGLRATGWLRQAAETGRLEPWKKEQELRSRLGQWAAAVHAADRYVAWRELEGDAVWATDAADRPFVDEAEVLENQRLALWREAYMGWRKAKIRAEGILPRLRATGLYGDDASSDASTRTFWVWEYLARCVGVEQGWSVAKAEWEVMAAQMLSTVGLDGAGRVGNGWHWLYKNWDEVFRRLAEAEADGTLSRWPGIVWCRPALDGVEGEYRAACREIVDTLPLDYESQVDHEAGAYAEYGYDPAESKTTVDLGQRSWRVLTVRGERRPGGGLSLRALLLSEDVVALAPFHDADGTVDWDRCWLRRTLNDEQAVRRLVGDEAYRYVLLRPVVTEGWDESGSGEDIVFQRTEKSNEDRVFLLNREEVLNYFNNMPVNKPQVYDHGQAKFEGEDVSAWWWLRSPGYAPAFVARVDTGGALGGYGGYDGVGVAAVGGVRPALWLNLES